MTESLLFAIIERMSDTEAKRNEDSTNDTTPGAHVGSLTKLLRACIHLLPANAPQFIYTKILRPWPLRQIANALLRKIIPPTITIPEGILYLNQNDPVVSGALLLGAYEAYFAEVFRAELRQGMTVLDIGANLGYYSLIASKTASRVVAFEPEDENRALLGRTQSVNNRTNIIVIDKGVSDSEGAGTLTIDPDNKGKHSLLPADGGVHVDITLTTVDATLEALGITDVGLIKMDIEGWEGHAFIGMQSLLARAHPTIMFEFAPMRIREAGKDGAVLLEYLWGLGYELWEIDEGAHQLVPLATHHELLKRLQKIDDYVNIIARHTNNLPTTHD